MKKTLKTMVASITVMSMLLINPVFAQEKTETTSATAVASTTVTNEVYDNDMEYLRSVMDMVKERYKGEITDKQLLEGALKGMFGSLDKYTEYYTPKEAESFLNEVEGEYEGVGLMMSKEDKHLIVIKVLPSSPAEKAGFLSGDKVVSIDDKSVDDLTNDIAVSLIRGKAGTKVKLGVIKNGKPEISNIELSRSAIKINPVTYHIKDGIGYIRLEIFNSNLETYLTDALKEMDSKSVKKIVLDLRNNPGGEVSQAIALANKFIPKGLITKLEFKSEEIPDREYRSELATLKYKLVVLVNGNSASASEIFAGALQDTKAGTLVGTKTYGKAKVQTLVPLLTPEAYKKYETHLKVKLVDAYDLINSYGIMPRDSEIIGWSKITIGEYTTPNGRMIDKKGLVPDVAVDDYKVINNIDINSIEKLTVTTKPELNSEGGDVYNAEKILKIAGYDVDTPDMKLDKKTFNAISKLQKSKGSTGYGKLDFTTQKWLNELLDRKVMEIDKQYAKAIELLSK